MRALDPARRFETRFDPKPDGHETPTDERRSDMLQAARIATRLPVRDLDRARAWYSEKLGLDPVEERPGGLLYRGASGAFVLFASAGAASGESTQMAFEVDDIEAAVAEMKRRGVVFDEVDIPGMTTVGGIATIEGNYPSKGVGELGAWFRDWRREPARHRSADTKRSG
jgi:catechol 2,3-dioxygenase-like lactoylglutathione lyase family enzyme